MADDPLFQLFRDIMAAPGKTQDKEPERTASEADQVSDAALSEAWEYAAADVRESLGKCSNIDEQVKRVCEMDDDDFCPGKAVLLARTVVKARLEAISLLSYLTSMKESAAGSLTEKLEAMIGSIHGNIFQYGQMFQTLEQRYLSFFGLTPEDVAELVFPEEEDDEESEADVGDSEAERTAAETDRADYNLVVAKTDGDVRVSFIKCDTIDCQVRKVYDMGNDEFCPEKAVKLARTVVKARLETISLLGHLTSMKKLVSNPPENVEMMIALVHNNAWRYGLMLQTLEQRYLSSFGLTPKDVEFSVFPEEEDDEGTETDADNGGDNSNQKTRAAATENTDVDTNLSPEVLSLLAQIGDLAKKVQELINRK